MNAPASISCRFLGLLLGSCLLSAAAVGAAPPVRAGDRIAIVGNTFADQLRVHGYLETLLLQHTAGKPVSVRNLGWGGDTLTARDRPTNFPTEESTLAAHKADVIVACFGMGESFAGEKGLSGFRSDLAAFIAFHRGKKYNGTSEVRLVLVSPIAYENLGKHTPAQERRNRELAAYSSAMGEVAATEGVPFVNLYEPSRYLMSEDGAPKLTTNGIHLNAYGYWALSRVLFAGLVAGEDHGEGGQPWLLRIDAAEGKGEARGVAISSLHRKDGEIRFNVAEKSGASLPPPGDAPPPPQLAGRRDLLFVENLAPGQYTLTVDGEVVISAGHEHWARGVPVDSSPAHREARTLREAVNDKNLQFTYSWKALNQVHIVGERKKSPSGRALPAEIIEFGKLASQRDKALRNRVVLKTREWRLSAKP